MAEASAAASLLHPNIVAIHDVGVCQGQQYFAMDYVEGQSLSKLLANGPLPARRAASYLKTVAEAIQYAHKRGILHRDLKPSNVLASQIFARRAARAGVQPVRTQRHALLSPARHAHGIRVARRCGDHFRPARSHRRPTRVTQAGGVGHRLAAGRVARSAQIPLGVTFRLLQTTSKIVCPFLRSFPVYEVMKQLNIVRVPGLAILLVNVVALPALAEEPPQLSGKHSSSGLELSWPATIQKTDGSVVRPYFELQRTFDFQRWEPIGERQRASRQRSASR